MKRTPLRSSNKPMARTELRRVRIRPRNEARARLKYMQNYGAWSDTIRDMPCWLCGRTRGIEAAHMIPRSRGGDRTVLLPLCGDDPRDGHVGCHSLVDSYRLGDRERLVREARLLYASYHKAAA